ncbi:YlbL family protein [Demequina aurantiaca]|uniref:YlbL family protein n=1 Tax=Demequina aurantiaca TaxID=676200 RepID=UPI003D32D9CA
MTLPPTSPVESAFAPGDAAEERPLEGPTPRVSTRRATVMSAAGLVTSILIAVLTVIPSQFAIGGPGPTYDTLGVDDSGEPLVAIEGAPTYPASGELRLTTVSVSRGGSSLFTMGSVLAGYFSSQRYVVPEEFVFGDPDQEADYDEQAQQDWITSQESATVSALEALGVPVPATIRVAGVQEDSNAVGLLQTDDVLTAIDGQPVETYTEMSEAVSVHEPGDMIQVTVMRGEEEVTESFEMLDAGDGTAVMGIWIDPTFDIPIDVTVQIDRVGGPSAGTMFSLAIMDKLTEEDELSGQNVAGTGTIDADGDVGPIGGIQFKMDGASKAGAEYFLAPVENCEDVRGHVPQGLSVFSVDNLDDAYTAVVAIGSGNTSQLPTC